MYVKQLTVKDFRNLLSQTIELGKGLNIFCGLNAQGKTNLMEGVVLCSFGKSPRTDNDKDLINWDKKTATVKTEFESKFGNKKIDIQLLRDGKKCVSVNSLPVKRIGELLGHLNVIYFSPEEIKVIREGPEERRRFMDIDLCQTDKNYLYALSKYNHILDQKNNLLKTQKFSESLKEMVGLWNIQLVEEGAKIFLKRQEFLSKLRPIVEKIHNNLTNKKEKLQLTYQTRLSGETAEEVKKMFLDKLNNSFEKEVKLGYTTFGVHRDDIKFAVDEIDIRNFGSQGQQRTTALSLKLAEIELIQDITKDTPILLLDDVFSEIDNERKAQLLKYTANIQTIITTTEFDEKLIGDVPYTLFNVSAGRAGAVSVKDQKRISVDTIMDAVVEYFNIEKSAMVGKKKTKK